MEKILKDHFGDRNIYKFNADASELSELNISINYVIISGEIYFVSEELSNDNRVELVFAKGEE